jgi:hypothetical protein
MMFINLTDLVVFYLQSAICHDFWQNVDFALGSAAKG